MRVILQRVNFASVEVNKKEVSRINKGLLLFVGFGKDDTDEDLKYIFRKILNLRIFEDQNYKMNLSVLDMSYEILIVHNLHFMEIVEKVIDLALMVVYPVLKLKGNMKNF